MTAAETAALTAIRIGGRHRKDLGDIEALAASIESIGLLQPIGITPSFELVFGERRFRAFEKLGREKIPVRFVDVDRLVMGEFTENTLRKDFTLSERVAILRTIERKPMGDQARSQNFATVDEAARIAGFGNRETARQAQEIVEAAAQDPEKFGKLLNHMDRTGRVNSPYRRLKVARQAEQIRLEPPPLPNRGPYRVIVADPPWPFIRAEDPSQRPAVSYPTMSIEKMCAMPVQGIAHEHCILWLWTTNTFMRRAFDVLDAWGFAPKTMLTWSKTHFGCGEWLRGQTEHAWLATRGKPVVQLTNQSTLLQAPVGAHSQKPEAFYELVEKLCPAPRYAELFARRQRPNWDGHGDEVEPAA